MGITRRTLLLLILGVAVTIGGGLFGYALWACIAYNGLLAIAFALDLILAPRKRGFALSRTCGALELLRPGEVRLELTLEKSERPVRVLLADTVPPELERDTDKPLALDCLPGQSAEATYTVTPSRRGRFPFGDLYAELTGPLGLCSRKLRIKCEGYAQVTPDLSPLRRWRLLAKRRELQRDNSSRHRVLGAGTDFRGLREYNGDDDIRLVNWSASARLNKPIANILDVEREQSVLLAVDCARVMRQQAGGLTRLDRTVECALALAGVALAGGDRVGALIYSGAVRSFVKPDKGTPQLSRIIDALYAVQPEQAESDCSALTAFLSTQFKKRALVCVFSHIADEASGARAAAALSPASKRHALMFVSVRSPGLAELARTPLTDTEDMYLRAAAEYCTQTTRAALHILSGAGVSTVSAEPDELVSESINKYLTMKKQMKI